MPLTPEDRAKGTRIAGTRLGAVGRSIRARRAAEARWGHSVKPDGKVRRPPAGWLLECLADLMDEYQGVTGYAMHRGRLVEILEWVKQCRKE